MTSLKCNYLFLCIVNYAKYINNKQKYNYLLLCDSFLNTSFTVGIMGWVVRFQIKVQMRVYLIEIVFEKYWKSGGKV